MTLVGWNETHTQFNMATYHAVISEVEATGCCPISISEAIVTECCPISQKICFY